MLKVIGIILLLLSVCFGQTGSIPQLQPQNTLLFTDTSYNLHYFNSQQMRANSYFQLNFTNSQITVPNGNITCVGKYNTTNTLSLSCSCTNKICRLALTSSFPGGSQIDISFGQLKNPYYKNVQQVNVLIIFATVSYSENYTVNINQNIYQPRILVVNSIVQSSYGVGDINTVYTLNISSSDYPQNPILQIIFPQQLQLTNVETNLSFYNSNANYDLIKLNKIFRFNLITAANTSPTGFIIIRFNGIQNLQYLGSSSSFSIRIFMPNSICSECLVAELTRNVLARSETPGILVLGSWTTSNQIVNEQTNLTVNLNLRAPLPIGGRLVVKLPLSLNFTFPLYCERLFGFLVTDNSPVKCVYDFNNHSIYTVNLAHPYIVGLGNGAFVFSLANARDTCKYDIAILTIDNLGRIIGQLLPLFSYNAIPSPLNINITKNQTQIEKPTKIQISMNIKKAIQSGDKIEIILPYTGNFNYSAITKCSNLTLSNLSCNVTLIQNDRIKISYIPSCAQTVCQPNTTFILTIQSFNPSFISEQSQKIVVQTASGCGIIEQSNISITLKTLELNVLQYKRIGGNFVGDYYDNGITFTLPSYVRNKGGKIQINYNEGNTYIDVNLTSNGLYTMLSSINVLGLNSVPLSNMLTYFTQTLPASLQKLTSNICQNNTCSTSTTNYTTVIKNLKQSSSTSPSCCEKIVITTVEGWSIAQKVINTSIYTPKKSTSQLSLVLTNSVANATSSYNFIFTSKNRILSPRFTMTLPSDNIIKSQNCFVVTSISLGYPFTCNVLNTSTIQIMYNGDATIMQNSQINYTITISNVTTPLSLLPLQYSIASNINGLQSQTWSTIYTLQNPYPISIIATKSNNTYNQLSNLNIVISNISSAYTRLYIIIPKTLLQLQQLANTPIYTYSQNQTTYKLLITNSLSQINVSIINPSSTGISNKIYVETELNGYLAGRGQQLIPKVQPMFLKTDISISNKIVGQQFTMNITIQRVNSNSNENKIRIIFPANAYNYSQATYLGVKLNTTLLLNLNQSNIIISNLRHLRYIPKLSSIQTLQISTLDLNQFQVSKSNINMQNLLPIIPAVSHMTSTRNSSKSNSPTELNINYQTLYGYSGCKMMINLPKTQNMFISTTKCTYGGLACDIKGTDNSTINITFTSNGIIKLENVMNIYPSNEQLIIILLTPNNEIIQKAVDIIKPSIKLQPLNVSMSIQDVLVSTNTIMSVNISINKTIQAQYYYEIRFNRYLFSKWPNINNNNCQYVINGNKYNTCQYTNYTDDGSLQSATFNEFPTPILPNQPIQLKLYITNSWSAIPFNDTVVTVNIYDNLNNIVGQGIIQMTSLIPFAKSFTPASVNNLQLNESNRQTNAVNNMNIVFALPIFTPAPSTYAMILIPKDTYNLANPYMEDNDYYIAKILLPCTILCYQKNNTISIPLQVKNNMYSPITRKNIGIYLSYSYGNVTALTYISTNSLIPTPIISQSQSLLIRTNNKADQQSSVQLNINLPVIFPNITIIISGKQLLLKTIQKVMFNFGNQTSQITYQVLNGNSLKIQRTNINALNISIVIDGKNPLIILKQVEAYNITISNSTHLLFGNTNVSPTNPLIPYNLGLKILRNVTQVSKETQLFLSGSILESIPGMKIIVNSNNYPLTSMNVNLSIGRVINPLLTSIVLSYDVQISNQTYIVYKNKQLEVMPQLTAITSITAITIPKNIYINSLVQIVVSTNSNASTKFNLIIPKFYTELTSCKVCFKDACNIQYQQCTITDNGLLLILANNQTIDKISFMVKSSKYHTYIPNAEIKFLSEPPSSLYILNQDILVQGNPIGLSVQLSSWTVNAISNYTVIVRPIKNIQGKLMIQLPQYLTQLKQPVIKNQAGTILAPQTNNGMYTFSDPLLGYYRVQFIGVMNPSDDRKLKFSVYQSQLASSLNIYGYASLQINMANLDKINVYQATRDIAKIGQPCVLTLIINTPSYASEQPLFIWFPSSQVVFKYNNCSISVNNIAQSCEYIGNNTIKTINKPGNYTYKVQGLSNNLISIRPSKSDQIEARIGIPYSKAKTTQFTTSYILPYTTAGTILLQSMEVSNLQRLEQTDIHYHIILQHYTNYNAIIIDFNKYNYYLNTQVKCLIEDIQLKCELMDSSTIIIYITENLPIFQKEKLHIKLTNVINYVVSRNTIITSLKKIDNGNYGDIDVLLFENANNNLLPTLDNVRIIIPYNYVNKQQEILFIVDSQLPMINISTLKQSLVENECHTANLQYNNSHKFKCNFTSAGMKQFLYSLYEQSLPNQALKYSKNNISILSQPTNNCENPDCDYCSISNNKQYCTSCREGMSSYNGICMKECPQAYYSHQQSKMCISCAPSCKRCYNPYDNNCLECLNTSLVLDSGRCLEKCQNGTQVNKVCVTQICSVEGCRICSNTGFCYECLPDYDGQPTCKTYRLLPSVFFTYFTIPFILLSLVVAIYSVAKCLGTQSVSSWLVFSLSFVEFTSWILSIPIVPNYAITMALSAFILIRLIISILSYEIHYSKSLNQLSEKLLSEQKSQNNKSQEQASNVPQQSWKVKLTKFCGHFLGSDSYQLLRVKIGLPILTINNENKIYIAVSCLNRIAVMVILGYVISTSRQKVNDTIFLPIIAIGSGFVILLCRLCMTDFVQRCFTRFT